MVNKSFKVRVPATSANMGPGFDSLGIAFQVYNEYSFTEIDEGIEFVGVEKEFSNKDNIILQAMEKVFEDYKYNYGGLKIEIINCDIPVSRGLGSSSSCIVAGLIGAFLIMGKEIEKNEILKYAVEIEGHPDNVCPAIFGGMVIAIMEEEKPIFNEVKIVSGVKFIALIPKFKLSTEKARAILPKTVQLKEAVYNIGRATLVTSIFANGNYNLLKYAMKDKLHQEHRGKLIEGYDILTEKSMEIGALAYFLSGAGPTIMTVVKDDDIIFEDTIKKFILEKKLNYEVRQLTVEENGATFLEVDKG